jgi:proline iminopeptidase
MTSEILFPPIDAYATHELKVSDLHTIYVEEAGNPKGKPVVFLHGGPGGGIEPLYRRFFNPSEYRIILFDQRGCGKSAPHAELRENTTWNLVSDIEKIREHLGIDKWSVFGGSWGSTLSLAYGISHPEKVVNLILRGIFLIRRFEIEWFYQCGASRIFPDAFKSYKSFIPHKEQNQLLRAYYARLTSNDEAVKLEAAKQWSKWEAATSKLIPSQEFVDEFDDDALALAFARIESHYFVNDGFFPSDHWLLNQIKDKLQDTPVYIVHGRYDVVCPIQNAFDLKEVLPNAEFVVSGTSGHSAQENETCKTLIDFTNKGLGDF